MSLQQLINELKSGDGPATAQQIAEKSKENPSNRQDMFRDLTSRIAVCIGSAANQNPDLRPQDITLEYSGETINLEIKQFNQTENYEFPRREIERLANQLVSQHINNNDTQNPRDSRESEELYVVVHEPPKHSSSEKSVAEISDTYQEYEEAENAARAVEKEFNLSAEVVTITHG